MLIFLSTRFAPRSSEDKPIQKKTLPKAWPLGSHNTPFRGKATSVSGGGRF
jgi:hypothetical protein